MSIEVPRAGLEADLLSIVTEMQSALRSMADSAVTEAESRLATLKSLREMIRSYDHALTVILQPGHPPNESPSGPK